MKYTLTLDVCLNDDASAATQKYVKFVEKKYGINARIISDAGPNGECPTIEFFGSKKNLQNFWVHDYSGADTLEEALDDYVGARSFDDILFN